MIRSESHFCDRRVEWLGEVPEHWKTTKVGFGYTIQLGKMLQPEPDKPSDVMVNYLKAVNVQWEEITVDDESLMWASNCDLSKYCIQHGDLLVCEGGEAGRAAILELEVGEMIIQNALHRVRSSENNVRYLLYLLQVASNQGWLDILCNKATIAHFTRDKFSELHIPYPPFTEQQTIVALLDRETARIDALIQKKERMIELLKEKRIALITQAVTKGLNPNAKMKDSGGEWLGQVPEHWDVKRLKYVSSCNDESLPETTDPDFEILYVDISSVSRIKGITTKEEMSFEDAPSRARRKVKDGDTIVSTVRTYLRAIAPIENAEVNLIVSTGFAVLRPVSVYSGYLSLIIQSHFVVESIVARSVGVSYPAINASDIGDICITNPPLNEQREIVYKVRKATSRIDEMQSKNEQSITLLHEYRTSLIHHAVTGKIDLRDTNEEL